ncbi:GNAT family N-acetyltransferase [Salinimicrobium sediminilitoris]|uniref:GNAT family N-acetyltransferase n=1 Tax=Salinimicrobium sediminilitoris TaxID=2876715 RepID=UPI001E37178B|nr:GNAT family N-acetyltransferase [Salinimicrobium sediminilitoris]MCC8360329.1 GNAT family N-acetyltransferase [Salinimicrobium sediminilitoris]
MDLSRIFETERLILRPTTTEDAAFIYELLNTPKWLQFIGDRNITSVEEAEQYIIDKMLPQLERLGFSNNCVIRKEDGAKIGTCGLYDREGVEGLDIGFAFLPQYENKGYGFEAASRIMKFALEELEVRTVAGITSRENLASQKLLKKLGMKFSGEINYQDDQEKSFLFRLSVPGDQ